MTQAAAIPMIWVPSITLRPCHFYYDFLEDFRVVCLLFFDDRIFFDVPLGQVSCGWGEFGWTTLVHGRLRYWVILLFVRHPAARGGWTLE